MQIDWWTLGLQAVNFLALVWLLSRFLYKPVREVIEKRKELAEQAFAEAARQKTEAQAALERYEKQQAELAEERQGMITRLHEEMASERRGILADAKREADKLLEGANRSVIKERAEVLADLKSEVISLATSLAADILSKVKLNADYGISVGYIIDQIEELPSDERDRLESDLSAKDARLTIVTAEPMSSKWQKQLSEKISSRLCGEDQIDFATDSAILGGVELHFPHAVLRFTWADQLRKAEQLLRRNEDAS